MHPSEDYNEPERSYPKGYSRFAQLNGGLLVVIVLLLVVGATREGAYSGLGYLLAVIVLLLIGAALNLLLALTSEGGRGVGLLAAVLYGLGFCLFMAAL